MRTIDVADLFLRDEQRIYGPCSPAQIKQLVATGRIDRDWSIGKSQAGPWVSAATIRGLFPTHDADLAGPRPPDRSPNRPAGLTRLGWSLVVSAAVLPWAGAVAFNGAWPVALPGLSHRPAVPVRPAPATGWYLEDLPDAVAQSRREGKDLLVIFTADWCGPCRRLKRDLAGAEAFRRDVLVCVVDCDKQRALSDLHGVQGIPDLRLYRLGEEVNRTTGYGGSLAALESWVQAR
jgi:thiol-disulfide isomerase/thioredoxin